MDIYERQFSAIREWQKQGVYKRLNIEEPKAALALLKNTTDNVVMTVV
jgi:hypothetical protein